MSEAESTAKEKAAQKARDEQERASLERAGFRPQVHAQEQFMLRIASKSTVRAELALRESVLYGAGSALSLGLAVVMFMTARGDIAIAPLLSGVWHAAFAFLAERKRKKRITTKGDDAFEGCERDSKGILRLATEKNERVLYEGDADGRERKTLRNISALVQVFWGILLAGIPGAVFAGLPAPLNMIATVVGTFLGSAIFGRGVRTAIATKPVERVVFTNKRVALLADEGVTHSILYKYLRHRPVVVGREEGRATFGAELRPIVSARPLPVHGLYGFHDIDLESAKKLAQEVMTERRAILAASDD